MVSILLTGCSTLGFGDFSDEKVELNTNQGEKNPVKFIYQPLIGGKHEIFLTGDFNNWSQTETLMEEHEGIYETTLYLKKGRYK